MNNKNQTKNKSGPKPETLRIESGEVDWKDALKHAMGKLKAKRDEADGEKPEKDKGQQG